MEIAIEEPCPSCGTAGAAPWGVRDGHRIVECRSCRLAFFEQGRRHVRDYDTYYTYTESWDGGDLTYEVEVRASRVRRQLRMLGGLVRGRRLVDIGAGPGYYCAVAAREGWEVTGVEISAPAVAIGTERLGVRYRSLEAIDAGWADVVCCRHVLEHVREIGPFLESIGRVLSPGGLLFVHVPHREPLSFLVRNLGDGDQRHLSSLYVPDHLLGFTERSLADVVSRRGFEVERIWTSGKLSSHSDPFFLRRIREGRRWGFLAKQVLRTSVDQAGALVGRGEWIVGLFRKPAASRGSGPAER